MTLVINISLYFCSFDDDAVVRVADTIMVCRTVVTGVSFVSGKR